VHLCYKVALSLRLLIIDSFYYYVGDEFSMSVFGAVNSDLL